MFLFHSMKYQSSQGENTVVSVRELCYLRKTENTQILEVINTHASKYKKEDESSVKHHFNYKSKNSQTLATPNGI